MQNAIHNKEKVAIKITLRLLIYLLVFMLSIGVNVKSVEAVSFEPSHFNQFGFRNAGFWFSLLSWGLVGLAALLVVLFIDDLPIVASLGIILAAGAGSFALIEYGDKLESRFLSSQASSDPRIFAQTWDEVEIRSTFQSDEEIAVGIYSVSNQQVQVAIYLVESDLQITISTENIPSLASNEFWKVYIGRLPAGEYQIFLYDRNERFLDKVLITVD